MTKITTNTVGGGKLPLDAHTVSKAEQFAKLNNIHRHEFEFISDQSGYKCGVCGEKTKYAYDYPRFSDAKSILEIMQKRDDFGVFICQVGKIKLNGEAEVNAYLEIYYILNPDKLLDEAIEWCISHKEE